MDTMAPIRQTLHRRRSISLAAAPTAAAAARREVAGAIDSWDVAVDPSVAALLASELVTNAIKHAAGQRVGVFISRGRDELRVEVHDTSRCVPVLMDAGADVEAGRGLVLVASLATDWGYYRTPAGKAVYFTLAFPAEADGGGRRGRDR